MPKIPCRPATGLQSPDSIDAIRAVAGPDYETAVIPEERRKYLSRYDAKSAHYEIASMQKPGELPSVIA